MMPLGIILLYYDGGRDLNLHPQTNVLSGIAHLSALTVRSRTGQRPLMAH